MERVIVYTTNSCPRCKVLKEKLKQANIPYTEYTDIEMMVEQGINEVPVLENKGVRYAFAEAVKAINTNLL